MKSNFTFLKGTCDKGGIFNTNSKDNSGTWVAVTVGTSRNYKTFKGAQRYMNNNGYQEVK